MDYPQDNSFLYIEKVLTRISKRNIIKEKCFSKDTFVDKGTSNFKAILPEYPMDE